MRPLPPAWPEVIPGLPILFVFVGSPDCFDHARRATRNGFVNHVALASAAQATEYHWPVVDLSVIVILFCQYDLHTEAQLVALLLAGEPEAILLRHWPDTNVIRCSP